MSYSTITFLTVVCLTGGLELTTDYSEVTMRQAARQIHSSAFWDNSHPSSDLSEAQLTFRFGQITVASAHLQHTALR